MMCEDDYGTLLLAEALLEECLLENMVLLKNSTPLSEHTQPKLAKAKTHLNSLLSRGRLEVCTSVTFSQFHVYVRLKPFVF